MMTLKHKVLNKIYPGKSTCPNSNTRSTPVSTYPTTNSYFCSNCIRLSLQNQYCQTHNLPIIHIRSDCRYFKWLDKHPPPSFPGYSITNKRAPKSSFSCSVLYLYEGENQEARQKLFYLLLLWWKQFPLKSFQRLL